MAKFDLFIDKLFEREGYVSNDPDDKGGFTVFGISTTYYPEDVEEIRDLSYPEAYVYAAKFYRKHFWNALRLDEVENQMIAEELCDTAVNTGKRNAVLFAQRALRLIKQKDGSKAQLKIDGRIGRFTLKAINEVLRPSVLYKAMNGYQFMYYLHRVESDKSQEKFFEGWLNKRVFEWED